MKYLQKKYDELQNVYGSKELSSVYGYGSQDNAKVALVFMNPTKRNIATSKSWKGIRAQWLGTKQIWDFLQKCGLISFELNEEIKTKKPTDWSEDFCVKVYDEVKENRVWITNLAKCTQVDARPLPDNIFIEYKDLLKKEIELVNPEKVIFFGNQVSSIMLNQNITVSTVRQKEFPLMINGKRYECYAVYYPVGNGRFNQDKSVEDVIAILNKK
ncbi:MAG: hypothetical protein IJB98_00095 [Clostridia bacterium]|nr:hypothetical protein [Clostridia bacterium]